MGIEVAGTQNPHLADNPYNFIRFGHAAIYKMSGVNNKSRRFVKQYFISWIDQPNRLKIRLVLPTPPFMLLYDRSIARSCDQEV